MAVPRTRKKKCEGECGERKLLMEFYVARSNKDGLQKWCKKCDGLKRKGCPEIKVVLPLSVIDCPRGRGQKVTVKDCEEHQGCNDACFTCEHFKEDKTLNAMSMEEEQEAKYTHQSIMAHEYDYDE